MLTIAEMVEPQSFIEISVVFLIVFLVVIFGFQGEKHGSWTFSQCFRCPRSWCGLRELLRTELG
jgi:hypothetical protein